MDTEKQRQRRCHDARMTESGNARSEQRMAARRALEWIGASKARLVFRYELVFAHSVNWSNYGICTLEMH